MPVFSCLEGFPELSFQRKRFQLGVVDDIYPDQTTSPFFSVLTVDSFLFSILNRDKKVRVQRSPDQYTDLFQVVTFVHDIKFRLSGSRRLFQGLFGMRNIVDQILGDLQTCENLVRSVDSDRGFQEQFSRLIGKSLQKHVNGSCTWRSPGARPGEQREGWKEPDSCKSLMESSFSSDINYVLK